MTRKHDERQNRAANGNTSEGDSSPLLDRVRITPSVEFEDPPQGADPAFLAVAKVGYLAADLHTSLERRQEAGAAIGRVFDRAYIDALEAVCDVCSAILERDAATGGSGSRMQRREFRFQRERNGILDDILESTRDIDGAGGGGLGGVGGGILGGGAVAAKGDALAGALPLAAASAAAGGAVAGSRKLPGVADTQDGRLSDMFSDDFGDRLGANFKNAVDPLGIGETLGRGAVDRLGSSSWLPSGDVLNYPTQSNCSLRGVTNIEAWCQTPTKVLCVPLVGWFQYHCAPTREWNTIKTVRGALVQQCRHPP